MREKSYDLYAIIFLIGVAAFASHQLFWAGQFSTFGENQKSLAHLANQLNIVKRKPHGLLSWLNASTGDQLRNKDQIFTYENSNASLLFENGISVELQENTLLRIEGQKGEQSSLKIDRGVVYAKLDNNKQALKVELKGKTYQIESKNARVQIHGDSKLGKIQALEGDIKLNSGGESLTLKKGQVLEYDKNKKKQLIKNLSIQIISPLNSQKIFWKTKPEVMLRWEGDLNESFTLEVSKDHNFEDLIYEEKLNKNSFKISLPGDGQYFWRVKNIKGSSGLSSFKILKDRAPIVLWPSKDIELLVNDDLYIEWAEENATNFEYLLESAKEKESKEVRATQLQFKNLQAGEYRFSVRVKDDLRPDSPWSISRNIKVLPKIILESPQFRFPTNEKKIVVYKVEGFANLKINWARVKGAKSYLLDYELNGQSFSKEVFTNEYIIKLKEGTNLSWRVRPVAGERAQSQFTPWYKSIIEVDVLAGALPEDGAKLELKRPGELVEFEWSGDVKKKYQFELSTDSNFESLVLNKTIKGNKISERFNDAGIYYWRSKVITENGEVVFSRPSRVIIEKSPPLNAPILKEKKIEIKLRKRSSSIFFKILNLIFPPVYAEEEVFASIEWEENPDAKAYKLEVFNDPQGLSKVFEIETENSFYEWEGPKAGIYYWRLAYLDYWGRLSPFSKLSKLEVVLSDNLIKPDKPSLKAPYHKREFSLKEILPTYFRWKKSKRAESYLFQIASSLKFKEILFEKKVNSNSIKVDLKKLRKKSRYYWRVTAKGSLEDNRSLRRSFSLNRIPKPEEKVSEEQEAKKRFEKLIDYPREEFLAFSFSPNSISYELSSVNFLAKIDGVSLMGLNVKYYKPFQSKYEMNLQAALRRGEVFESLDYKDLFLKADFGKSYDIGNMKNWGASLGGVFRIVSSYMVSDTTLAADVNRTLLSENKTLFGGSAEFFYRWRSSFKWGGRIHAQVGFGNLFEWIGAYELRKYKYNEDFYFMRLGLSGNSYDAATEGEVSTSSIFLDLGYAL